MRAALAVTGEVEEPLTLSFEELRQLPATEVTTDIHCVTRWSRFDAHFKGVHWRELAKLCGPKPSARFAIAHAEHGYTANVPLEALEDEHALVVYEADGAPLTPEHGWPRGGQSSPARPPRRAQPTPRRHATG